MTLNRPFRRTARPGPDGSFSEGGRLRYVLHPKYCQDPIHYLRSAQMLEQDVLDLFQYIEPACENLSTFSFRTYELFLRICTEVETNLKAILRENGYNRDRDWNMRDYSKVEQSHFLSLYEVRIRNWRNGPFDLIPFRAWSDQAILPWYSDYNDVKHDRNLEFSKANFENLLHAMAGLIVVLASQFWTEDFAQDDNIVTSGKWPNDGFETILGGSCFLVRIRTQMNEKDCYDFEWSDLSSIDDPFINFNFT